MGDWAIVIKGNGTHHNDANTDADAMTDQFVQMLLSTGMQKVYSATFTTTDLRREPGKRTDSK